MDQLFIREMMNAALAVGSFGIVIVTFIYLLPRMRESGWYNSHANRLAIGIAVYFLGAGIYRTFAVPLLWSQRAGVWPHNYLVETAFGFAVTGYLIASFGLLCTARLLTKPPGHWTWFSIYCAMWGAVILVYLFG